MSAEQAKHKPLDVEAILARFDAVEHHRTVCQRPRCEGREHYVGDIPALCAEVLRLREALADWWFDATAQHHRKTCGHPFSCTCIDKKVRAALGIPEITP